MPQEQAILTISIAAKLLKIHQRTLMLYEKSGLINPHRTSTNRRLFSIIDLQKLQFIKVCEQNDIRLKRRLFPTFRLKKLI